MLNNWLTFHLVEIFSGFRDGMRNSKSCLMSSDDCKGILALYEAAYHLEEGANIFFHEAIKFTTRYLKKLHQKIWRGSISGHTGESCIGECWGWRPASSLLFTKEDPIRTLSCSSFLIWISTECKRRTKKILRMLPGAISAPCIFDD